MNETLSPRKLEQLKKITQNPNKLNPNMIKNLLKQTGIDMKTLKKQMNNINNEKKKEKKLKFPMNEKCFCESGKKYKKCCFLLEN